MSRPEPRHIPLRRFAWMILVVCLGAAALGFLAGSFAGFGYGVEYNYHPPRSELPVDPTLSLLGVCLGTATGIASGITWCAIMIRRGRRGLDQRLVAVGATLGLAFGVASTVVLHAALIVTVLCNSPKPMGSEAALFVLIGLGCGTVSGPLLGLLGGSLCQWAIRPPDVAEGRDLGQDESA